MSKPIMLTDELIASIQQEFIENVKKMKMFDGQLNYTKKFKWNGNDRATVVFSSVAFAKMTMLVQSFNSEVAWHGIAYRDEDDDSKFYITDILVYPQVVTGATVNTDQEAYQTWLYSHDDEVFNNIRMQGHSHVDFGVTPSGVDTLHQEKILSQVDNDMFYIFMIWNKKLDRNIKIFDMANNTLYETEDVDLYIGEDDCDLNAFVNNAKEIVKTKTYQFGQSSTTYGKSQTAAQSKDVPAKAKDKAGFKNEKPNIGSSKKNYNFNGYTDDDEEQFNFYKYGYIN